MVTHLGLTGKYNRITIEAACDSPGCGVSERSYGIGKIAFEQILRDNGWTIGRYAHCPKCNHDSVRTVQCHVCHKITRDESFRNTTKPLSEYMFHKKLRRAGWVIGNHQSTCPMCLVTRPSRNISLNVFSVKVLVNGNPVYQEDVTSKDVITFEIYQPDDCKEIVSSTDIVVGSRGGITFFRNNHLVKH